MAIANRISVTIPATVITDVTTKLLDAFTLLKPYLVNNLSKEDLQNVAKMGDKSEPFVEKGLEQSKNNASLVPAWVTVSEADKDFLYFKVMRPIETILQQMFEAVSNSRTEAGAEALDAMNDFYKSIQQAAHTGVAIAIPIYEELKKRYAYNGVRKRPGTDDAKK